MALALTSYPTAVGAWLWAGVGSTPLCLAALLKTLHESPGDGTFPSLVRELHCLCYHSLEGAMGCWRMALSGSVLSLGVVLRPALQGGSRVLHPRLGYEHPHPQQSHFGVWAAPRPHQTPQPSYCSAGCPCRGYLQLPMDGSLSSLLGLLQGCGAGQGRWHLPGVCSPWLLS